MVYILFACLHHMCSHLSFFLFPTCHFSSLFLTYLLPYLSLPLRIDPLHFQARCRKRWLNVALVSVLILCCRVLLCMHVWFGCIRFSFYLQRFSCIFVFFCVSLDHFGFVFSNFVLLGLVFSVPSQEIDWEECLWNDLFCVRWVVNPYSVQCWVCQ